MAMDPDGAWAFDSNEAQFPGFEVTENHECSSAGIATENLDVSHCSGGQAPASSTHQLLNCRDTVTHVDHDEAQLLAFEETGNLDQPSEVIAAMNVCESQYHAAQAQNPKTRLLSKDSYKHENFLDSVRATLAKVRFGTNTVLGSCRPTFDMDAIKVPQTYKNWLGYHQTLQALPRGLSYEANDLSRHSYLRDASASQTNRARTFNQDSEGGKSASFSLSSQTAKKSLVFVDQTPVIKEGYLVRQSTNWAGKPATEAEIIAWKFFLLTEEEAASVRALKSKTENADQQMDQNVLGPGLCVALPNLKPLLEDPACHEALHPLEQADAAGNKRKFQGEVVNTIFEMLVQEGFLSQSRRQTQPAADGQQISGSEDLKDTIREGLDTFLDGLRYKHEKGRWPDYVFDDDFVLPWIYEVFKQATHLKHLPGIVPASRVDMGDFNARREIQAVLKYVEIYLFWFQDHAENFKKLEKAQHAMQQENGNLCARISALERLVQENSPPQAAGVVWKCKFGTGLRPYQAEALRQCLQENTIVNLATGKGKTLIAIRAIDEFLGRNPDKAALFIVPTRALVAQQAQAIRKFSQVLPTSGDSEVFFTNGVAELAGTEMDGWTAHDWHSCLLHNKVLVGTPAVFDSAFNAHGFLQVRQFSVIVFDECHAAVGNSPMAVIMRCAVSRVPSHERPRIIGLTGSFINGKVTDQNAPAKRTDLCKTLQSRMCVPQISDEQTKQYHAVCWEKTVMSEKHAESVVDMFVTPLLAQFRTIVGRVKDTAKISRRSLEVLQQLGFGGFRFYIMYGLIVELEAKAMTHTSLQGSSSLNIQRNGKAVLENLGQLREALQESFERIENNMSMLLPCVAMWTNKATVLVNLLKEIKAKGPESQGIVFCAQNCLVHPMAYLCSEHGFRAAAVAGVGSMTDARREEALKQFAANQLDLLISTNAVEEGLDVAECSFVIRFDKFDTTKSHIQGSGRARTQEAEIYYFNNDVDVERQKEILLGQVANNRALDLPAEELLADGSQFSVLDRHPYPPDGSQVSGTGVVLFSNCLQIFMEYCVKVLQQNTTLDSFLRYENAGLHTLAEKQAVRSCRFPSPEGWKEVTMENVDKYWGNTALDPIMMKKDRAAEKRFVFVVVVEMRLCGVLDARNQPTTDAIQRCRDRCPLPRVENHFDLLPRFPGHQEKPSAALLWTGQDYKSMLNQLCQQKFTQAFTCTYFPAASSEWRVGLFASSLVVKSPLLKATLQVKGTPFSKKKDAEQAAAMVAYHTLVDLFDDSSAASGNAGSQDTDVQATSQSKSRSTARDDGVWPEQDFKSMLNMAKTKQGAVKYETEKTELGLFVSTVVVGVQRFEGRPCPSKKAAEQFAAKAALNSCLQTR